MPESDIILSATRVVTMAPLMLLWLVGLILALAWRARHPLASTLAAVAFGCFLFNAILGIGTSSLPMRWIDEGHDIESVSIWIGLLGLGRTAISCIAWGLLLAALFSKRPRPN